MSLSKQDLEVTNILVDGSRLVGAVIYTAIVCKSYPTLPRHVALIVDKVTEIYKKEFDKIAGDFYYKEFKTMVELESWVEEHILTIPEIIDLNLSQKEYDNGVKVDEDRKQYTFVSRHSKPVIEEDDFIDLDAYCRNLVQFLIRENVRIDYSTFR